MDFLLDELKGDVSDMVCGVCAVGLGGPAVGVDRGDGVVCVVRGDPCGVGAAEDEHDGYTEGGGDVAGAGVVGDDEFRICHEGDELGE